MILEKSALALRSVMLRTARSPLRPLWSGLYGAVARGVAVIVAPRRTKASVYLTGSLAGGEPVYGVSDIDLVAVAAEADEARRVRRRFAALSRALPPLRELVPHFFTYDERDLARALAGPYPVNGLDEGREALVGPNAPADEAGLLERPGLHGAPEWRRLRGTHDLPRPAAADRRVLAAWLELQYRWKWGLYTCTTPANVNRPALGLVVEAARIWLWLARGERRDGRREPLERALGVMDAEEEGLRHALEVHRGLHRSPPLDFELLFRTFTSLSAAIARLVDDAAREAGVTEVALLGAPNGGGVPMADWRALALPELDWAPDGSRLVEEQLEPQAGDPGDPAAVAAAAARDTPGRVPVMRTGSLLVEPTLDLWGRGRLRTVQCPASDPVSFALLDGRAHASFPELPGWSVRDWAGRAVAEHRAWLAAGGDAIPSAGDWIAARPRVVWRDPGTVGLLLSAARAALLLESVESGRPVLPLTLADVVAGLAERAPGVEADVIEARAAPSEPVVERVRRQVESLPAYKGRLRALQRRPPDGRASGHSRERVRQVIPDISYLVCATARSGTNLLCGLLRGTGVAGRPEEYFGYVRELYFARRWGASRPVEYVHGAIREGTGANGVFGAKVLWPHFPNLLAKLEAVHGRDVEERVLLERTFPGLRFVWIRREDVVAQAVSFAKAMQTDQWTTLDQRRSPRVPSFDFDQIHQFVVELEAQEAAWGRWFRANGIAPFDVRYEDLATDMEGVTRGVLGFLGVVPGDTPIEPPHARQADAVNAEWAARYRQMVP